MPDRVLWSSWLRPCSFFCVLKGHSVNDLNSSGPNELSTIMPVNRQSILIRADLLHKSDEKFLYHHSNWKHPMDNKWGLDSDKARQDPSQWRDRRFQIPTKLRTSFGLWEISSESLLPLFVKAHSIWKSPKSSIAWSSSSLPLIEARCSQNFFCLPICAFQKWPPR
jgi:hypothetical protein